MSHFRLRLWPSGSHCRWIPHTDQDIFIQVFNSKIFQGFVLGLIIWGKKKKFQLPNVGVNYVKQSLIFRSKGGRKKHYFWSCRLLGRFFCYHYPRWSSDFFTPAVGCSCFSGKLGVKVSAESSYCPGFSWDRVVFSFIVAGMMLCFGLERKKNCW